ncbi:TspO/MBR family protein [Pseudonocardia sp. TRM90224]|uniref:TspO/MBR family protein n=1 Tax=Pseudonocardia sp. TRM90224 TaxID=2812678 RepID=UPI001E37128D|nr:TspO/MBR family protein [Pseudonocardia sp. TRM90224]
MTAAGATLVAAGAGNALISKDDLNWLYGLRQPRMQLPLPGFAAVGVVYYALLGCVLYRAVDRRDSVATRLALVVLVLNEVWNVGFFGRRSVRTGFFGILVFLVPLAALQIAVAKDRRSSVLLAPYTAWVICYDVPWTLQLWRLNPDRPQACAAHHRE